MTEVVSHFHHTVHGRTYDVFITKETVHRQHLYKWIIEHKDNVVYSKSIFVQEKLALSDAIWYIDYLSKPYLYKIKATIKSIFLGNPSYDPNKIS